MYRVLRVSEELRRATSKALRHQGLPHQGHPVRGHHDVARGRLAFGYVGDQWPEGYEHEPVKVVAAVESRDFRPLAALASPLVASPLWRLRHSSGVGATVQGFIWPPRAPNEWRDVRPQAQRV